MLVLRSRNQQRGWSRPTQNTTNKQKLENEDIENTQHNQLRKHLKDFKRIAAFWSCISTKRKISWTMRKRKLTERERDSFFFFYGIQKSFYFSPFKWPKLLHGTYDPHDLGFLSFQSKVWHSSRERIFGITQVNPSKHSKRERDLYCLFFYQKIPKPALGNQMWNWGLWEARDPSKWL